MSIQYNLTANNGQITEPVAIMSNTKVTAVNGYIQWAPNTLADYKNNEVVWQTWPVGSVAGNAISTNQMIIRLVGLSSGASAIVDQGNKGAGTYGPTPANAYWLVANTLYGIDGLSISGGSSSSSYDTVTISATTVGIRSAPTLVAGFTCTASSSGNITIFDNIANSGNIIWTGNVNAGQIVTFPAPYQAYIGVSLLLNSGTMSINLSVK